jgi:alpha-beta hydrolase superfamily lysophospholipase
MAMSSRSGRALAAAALLAAGVAALGASSNPVESALETFRADAALELGPVSLERSALPGGGERVEIVSEKLRGPGNAPVILHHGRRTEDAIVLIHGLTDSPHYMEAIGRVFHAAGVTVVLPLLPGHGLREPDADMEDSRLAERWKATADRAVALAAVLSDRVSMGGFSTGGALSVNKTLRSPEQVQGGVFLFSAALSVGTLNELAGHGVFFLPWVARLQDGEFRGEGPNPYHYPRFSQYGGLQLTHVIDENNELLERAPFPRPVFAVHSIHDTAALVQGIGDLFRRLAGTGIGIVLAHQPPVEHGSIPLAEDIELDLSKLGPGEEAPPVPRANPNFRGMAELAVGFLRRYVQGRSPFGDD